MTIFHHEMTLSLLSAVGQQAMSWHFSLAETTLHKVANNSVPLKIPIFKENLFFIGSITWCHSEQEQRFSVCCRACHRLTFAVLALLEKSSLEQRAGIPQGCAGRLKPATVWMWMLLVQEISHVLYSQPCSDTAGTLAFQNPGTWFVGAEWDLWIPPLWATRETHKAQVWGLKLTLFVYLMSGLFIYGWGFCGTWCEWFSFHPQAFPDLLPFAQPQWKELGWFHLKAPRDKGQFAKSFLCMCLPFAPREKEKQKRSVFTWKRCFSSLN